MINFSVITPVFNGSKYINELILSVKNQDYLGKIEHIVINDGSNDGGATQEIIDKYPHLITKSRHNLGQYASINEGIKMATGDYVVVICADDLFMDEHVFTNIYNALVGNKNINLIYGRTLRITETGENVQYDGIVIREPFTKWRFKYQLPLLHCSAFVRRSFLTSNNLYFDNVNFKYAADWDWFLRMSKLTDFEYVNLIISKYRVHASQTTNTVGRDALTAEDISVLRKNGSSILIYNIVIYIERIKKAHMLFKEKGFNSLYKKVASFIK